MNSVLLRAVPVVIGVVLLGACAEGPSHVSFDDALKSAVATNKVVFAEFGATWCEPCKRLERTTLKDERVLSWLDERCVLVHVDIDEQPALASEFGVKSVPTMVFVKADRSVAGTISGYRDVDAFLAEAERRIAGVSAVSDAAEAVRNRPDDLMARNLYFEELVRSGDRDGALEQAEHYWVKSRDDEMHMGVRVSFFLASMGRLAETFEPARRAMRRWQDEAYERMSHGDEDERLATAREFAALTRNSGDGDAMVRAAEAADEKVRRALVAADKKPFLDGKRYQLLVDCGFCEPPKLAKRMEQLRRAKGADTPLGKVVREKAHDDLATACEALAGVGRDDDALAVVALALEDRTMESVRSRMAGAVQRAGKPELAARIRDGK